MNFEDELDNHHFFREDLSNNLIQFAPHKPLGDKTIVYLFNHKGHLVGELKEALTKLTEFPVPKTNW